MTCLTGVLEKKNNVFLYIYFFEKYSGKKGVDKFMVPSRVLLPLHDSRRGHCELLVGR